MVCRAGAGTHLLFASWRGEWVFVRSCIMPTVTAGQAYFPMQWWPFSPRVFYCSGQLPAQPTPQDDPISCLHGFCQDCFLSFTIASSQTSVSRDLGIWLSFFFQKLFDAHCSVCQTFWTCRERLNKEQPHGRNASLNKKLGEQSGSSFPMVSDLMVRFFSI